MTSETVASPESVCPYCRSGFEAEDVVKACPVCATLHHEDCFVENGGCTIFGCPAAPADDPKITLTPTDLQPPPAAPAGASFYNLRSSPQRAVAAVMPPPPRPDGSPEPPPLVTYPAYAYAYSSSIRPKSRVTYVLLALFLGSFGLHNFYAGYSRKAAIQLCVSLLTCLWLSPIMWIWAIVEACTISAADDGVPFA